MLVARAYCRLELSLTAAGHPCADSTRAFLMPAEAFDDGGQAPSSNVFAHAESLRFIRGVVSVEGSKVEGVRGWQSREEKGSFTS